MQYRTLGWTGFRPSILGFGAMRLPELPADVETPDGPYGRIDVAAADAMLLRAVQAGVNYVDTAYPYHGGASERWLGHGLRVVAAELHGPGDEGLARLRGQLKVATKLPMWLIRSRADCERYFGEQLERLQLDSVDFYLLHGLKEGSVGQLAECDVLGWAADALAAGRIGHLGFSFHDQGAVFPDIVDATDLWEFCQIQYNFMDEEYQAGTAGLEYAAAKGLGVIVMEPLRGGRLARRPPEAVAALWAAANARREAGGEPPWTPVEWALQWVWDHPDVAFLLSGMSDSEQLEQNLAIAERAAAPGSLGEADLAVYREVKQAYVASSPIDCTQCRYCLPCPQGVGIPELFGMYNDSVIYGTGAPGMRISYGWFPDDKKAELCTACHECEALCPQQIGIADWMEKICDYVAED